MGAIALDGIGGVEPGVRETTRPRSSGCASSVASSSRRAWSSRSRRTPSRPTTRSRPAEASANLARYDGVRYGLRVPGDDVFAMYDETRRQGFGREVKRRCLIGAYALSAGYYDAYYGQAQRVRTLIRRDFDKAFEQCDVLLTPTSPTVAFRIGELVDNPLAMYACDLFTLPVQPLGPACDLAPVRPLGRPARWAPSGRARIQREPPSGGRARARGGLRVRSAPAGAGRCRMSVPEGWEAVIGLEIHVQLSTRSKMFCRCPNESGGDPTRASAPSARRSRGRCRSPTARPSSARSRSGSRFGSEIAPHSTFHRKNYFYPDSPKAYQISQYDEPLCSGGRLAVPTAEGDDVVGFERVHLEEDAAKTVHEGGGGGRLAGSHRGAVVDFNRCGTPLMEMVTRPDLRTPEQPRASRPSCARRSWRSASPTATWRRARCASTPTSACGGRARPSSARRPSSRT